MASSLRNDLGLALLRISASAFLLSHGFPKFQKMLQGDFEFADPLGIGAAPSLFLIVLAEFVCPILIIIGIKTRWAAVPPALAMGVVAFLHHATDPFGTKEKALLFMVMFLCIILLGPGRYSIDKR